MAQLTKKLLDLLDENNFAVCSTDKQNGEFVSEVETFSPLGEDLIITIWHNNTNRSFIDAFWRYAFDYDADEHAEFWIEHREENGVPKSCRALIDDADAIGEMLLAMAEKLMKIRR